MEMFAAGILLALWHRKNGPMLRGWPLRSLLLTAVPIVWYCVVRLLKVKRGPAHGPVSQCAGFLLVAISCAVVLDALTGVQRCPAALVYLGRISFGLYVFHAPVYLLSERYLPHLRFAVIFAGDLLIVVAAASLSYRYLETPFLRLKERFEVVKSRPIA